MTVGELFYFTLPSPSLDKSKSFFGDVFGWQVGGGSQGGHVSSPSTPLGLGGDENQVYFFVKKLQESIELVKQEGGSILEEKDFEGIGKAAFCQDNQGTRFVLQEPTPNLMEHALNPKKGCKHGDLFFYSLPVMDELKAKAFFSTVLQFEFGSKGNEGGMGMTNLKGPDGGLGCGRPGHYPSFWFRIEGKVEDCMSKITKAGGTAGELFEAPEGRMSECTDDQGVKFGIVEPADGY